jgi:uncharacterized membrane protein YcaP (DUF421 family)
MPVKGAFLMIEIPMWEFCLRVVSLYLIVMVALRVMGKREIGQLSIFDFVVSVMIAELSTMPMEDPSIPFYLAPLAIGMLVALQIMVAVIQLKSRRFRNLVDGEPSVLIEHGQIQDKEMKKTRYTLSDLMMQLREKGVAHVADVEFAILETSGKLSVLPKSEKRPLTATDVSQPVLPETIPMPLVEDGQPVAKTLTTLKRDQAWLSEQLRRRGYAKIEDVFYATIDQSGTLFIDAIDGTSAVYRDPQHSKTITQQKE